MQEIFKLGISVEIDPINRQLFNNLAIDIALCPSHIHIHSKMDYYNTISGPSSRPYDPNSYSNPSGSSTTPSTQSPQFPSYPMMTDLDGHYNSNNNNSNNNADLDDEDGQVGGGVEVDDTAPLVEPHQDLDSFLETFWTRQMAVVERDNPDFKTYPLPLARIKKVMKSDEDVKVGQMVTIVVVVRAALMMVS